MAKKKSQAPSDTERVFLQSICETPTDDTPRLVFADWLEDNGDPEWAEFIRTQIRLARLDEYDYERGDLLFREKQLLRAHGKKWSKDAKKYTARIEFSRGFVGEMAMPAAKFVENAEAMFAAVPLTILRPLQVKTSWNEFLASPSLGRLRSLDLHFTQLGLARTVALADCIHLTNLEELNLGTATPRPGGLAALLQSPHLRNVRTLDLNNNGFDSATCSLLARSGANFPRLRHLVLSCNPIPVEGAARLAEAGWLRQLESLNLSGCSIGDEGVRRLADSGIWANLRKLVLDTDSISREGCRTILECPHLERVTDLLLPTWNIPVGLLEGLVRTPHLRSLRGLNLRNAKVSDAEIDALVDSPLAPRLRYLSLSGLSSHGLRRILSAPSLSGLVALNLSGHDNQYGRSGGPVLGQLLREATHLTRLDWLDVSFCHLGDAGMANLAAAAHLGSVGELNVHGNTLSDVSFEPLIRSPHFTRLRKLTIGEIGRIQGAGRQRVIDHFGTDVVQ